MRHSSEKKAGDIMHSGVEIIPSSEELHAAVALMRKKGISQLPVAEGRKIIGSISEQSVLEQFSAGKNLSHCRVEEAMAEAFPTVLPDAPLSSIAQLLQHYPAVLVLQRGEIAGIITKADLLKAV
jgi:predicted transcriptional regulator